ncbi:MAG: hypothetical protein H0X37_11360 [Herpetosiphonaceae bacterium]|nr:hypothetical protein [Herpetosiphonaceae bacterium]
MTHKYLRPSEIQLLYEVISRQDPGLKPVLDSLGVVTLTQQRRESLRGAIAAELTETGLDEEYEPNQRGLLLEELIDALGYL